MKILTIGGATQDIFIEYERPETLQMYTQQGKRSFLIFEEGKKIEIDELIYSTGGGATNSAVSFKRLGLNVVPFCNIGNDQAGQTIIQKLICEGISSHLIVQDAHFSTGQSLIFPAKSGDRTILTVRGANMHLSLKNLPLNALQDIDCIYITSLTGESAQQLLPIAELTKKNGALVAVNPGGSQLENGAVILIAALAYVDILILNSLEANQLMISLLQSTQQTNNKALQISAMVSSKESPRLLQSIMQYRSHCFNLSQFFKEIITRGPSIVIVTDGAQGVYAATKEAIFFHPSFPTTVINTVGAGDAFGSCFVAAIAQGKPMEQAIVCGILNSCSVIAAQDAKTGLLTQAELDQKIEHVDKNLLKKFSYHL